MSEEAGVHFPCASSSWGSCPIRAFWDSRQLIHPQHAQLAWLYGMCLTLTQVLGNGCPAEATQSWCHSEN